MIGPCDQQDFLNRTGVSTECHNKISVVEVAMPLTRAASALSQVQIALAVTAAASTLQTVYNPGKTVLMGAWSANLIIFLIFSLLKVLGLVALSLLYARACNIGCARETNLRSADVALGVTLLGSAILALYIFVGIRGIQSSAFTNHWGAGLPQCMAGVAMAAIACGFGAPLYARQYHDLGLIAGIERSRLDRIRGDKAANSRFVTTFSKRFAFAFLPLFAAHVLLTKLALARHDLLLSACSDAIVTCAMSIMSGFFVASALCDESHDHARESA